MWIITSRMAAFKLTYKTPCVQTESNMLIFFENIKTVNLTILSCSVVLLVLGFFVENYIVMLLSVRLYLNFP